MNQLSMPVAELLRDVGIARSADRAERVVPGWTDAALVAVRVYAMRTEGMFTGEDLVDAYHANPANIAPPSDKAFGAVIKRAIKEGVIEFVDFCGKRRKGHCSPCPRYRSRIVGKRYTEVA